MTWVEMLLDRPTGDIATGRSRRNAINGVRGLPKEVTARTRVQTEVHRTGATIPGAVAESDACFYTHKYIIYVYY